DGHTGTFQASPGTLANALNSGNIVPVGDGDLIWSATFSGKSETLSAGTSPNAFTQRGVGGTTDNVSMQIEDFIQSTHASIAATATTNTNVGNVTFVAAFKAAAAAAPATTLAMMGVG